VYRYADPMTDPDAELRTLTDATRRYRRAEKALEEARAAVIAAVIEALRAGARPTDVDAASPFTPAYNRRRAREAGIRPARARPQ
jgi:uncharacterized MAPEG superfamily protein